jgi:hypothetical protein
MAPNLFFIKDSFKNTMTTGRVTIIIIIAIAKIDEKTLVRVLNYNYNAIFNVLMYLTEYKFRKLHNPNSIYPSKKNLIIPLKNSFPFTNLYILSTLIV